MNMEDFHCDMFDLDFDFSEEDFDKASFLKEIGVTDEAEHVDEDGDLVLHVSLVSREETPKHHGDLRIIIFTDKTGNVDLNFHRHGHKRLDKKPPYLEDVAQWLSRFFKIDNVPAMIDVQYQFDKGFAPVIPLPFPLVTSKKSLSGLKVSGLSLEYPEEHPVESVIFQVAQDTGPYLFVKAATVFDFKEFDLLQELARLKGIVVNSLIKKQENADVDERETEKV
jgi:hypothetical protein